MIDINKQYRTRDGRKVRLFTTESRDKEYPVIGEYLNNEGSWENITWTLDGKYHDGRPQSKYDLIEVPQKWRGEVWLKGSRIEHVIPSEQDVDWEAGGWRKITVEEVES